MFEEIEEKIGYTFKDKELLRRALTLASYDGEFNNQTLEFFGDAILEFVVSEKIFKIDSDEGSLTDRRRALVADIALEPVSKKLGLDKHFIRNPNDTKNKKAIPSAYEALIAAIYLDGGLDEARKFVCSTLDFDCAFADVNYKGQLQEELQARGEPTPRYKVSNLGTSRAPKFCAEVTVFGQTFSGAAGNKRAAEQLAAKAAVEYAKKI